VQDGRYSELTRIFVFVKPTYRSAKGQSPVTEMAWVPTVVVLVAASVGAVTDVWKYRVYNALTIPLFLSGLAYHGVTHGIDGIWLSMGGALFGFGVLIVPYALGLMGAGDVKLLTGVGAWLGLQATITVFVASALIAGTYAILLIIVRGKLRDSVLSLKLIFYRFALMGRHFGKDDLVEELSVGADHRLRVIPFGAMVPLGLIAALLWTYWH
jgi:prepilin peptidase CpaA